MRVLYGATETPSRDSQNVDRPIAELAELVETGKNDYQISKLYGVHIKPDSPDDIQRQKEKEQIAEVEEFMLDLKLKKGDQREDVEALQKFLEDRNDIPRHLKFKYITDIMYQPAQIDIERDAKRREAEMEFEKLMQNSRPRNGSPSKRPKEFTEKALQNDNGESESRQKETEFDRFKQTSRVGNQGPRNRYPMDLTKETLKADNDKGERRQQGTEYDRFMQTSRDPNERPRNRNSMAFMKEAMQNEKDNVESERRQQEMELDRGRQSSKLRQGHSSRNGGASDMRNLPPMFDQGGPRFGSSQRYSRFGG